MVQRVQENMVTPLITNLKPDPFERFHEARGFDEWQENRSWTLAQVSVFLKSLRDYPPRQKSIDFNIDAIMEISKRTLKIRSVLRYRVMMPFCCNTCVRIWRQADPLCSSGISAFATKCDYEPRNREMEDACVGESMVSVFGGLEPTCLRPPQSFPDRIDGGNLLPSPPFAAGGRHVPSHAVGRPFGMGTDYH